MAYVLVGHFASVVAVSTSQKRKHGDRATLPATSGGVLHDTAVSEHVQASQLRAVDSFVRLRAANPGKAEAFLSTFFDSRKRFDVALVDPKDGALLSEADMLQAIQDDLMARAQNSFPQDPEAARALAEAVQEIRRTGAPPPTTAAPLLPSPPTGPYTEEEVAGVLATFKLQKKCLGLPYAALCANSREGLSLTTALVNLGRHMGLTASAWSTRVFSPIRKGGPFHCSTRADAAPDLAFVRHGAGPGRALDCEVRRRDSALLRPGADGGDL